MTWTNSEKKWRYIYIYIYQWRFEEQGSVFFAWFPKKWLPTPTDQPLQNAGVTWESVGLSFSNSQHEAPFFLAPFQWLRRKTETSDDVDNIIPLCAWFCRKKTGFFFEHGKIWGKKHEESIGQNHHLSHPNGGSISWFPMRRLRSSCPLEKKNSDFIPCYTPNKTTRHGKTLRKTVSFGETLSRPTS